MPIRLSGINSGLDTDALVKELVSAYSLKTEKYQKQQTKLEWKKDAWQGLNAKIYSLYTNISNLRYDSAYNLKRTSVSDATKAKVTASSEAVSGTQKLQILETAQASYITGGKLEDDVTSSTRMSALGFEGETTIEVRTKGGDKKEIKITADTKISEVVTQLRDAGLNASFDANNKRFFVSSKETGADNDFDLCAIDEKGQEALKALGLDASIVEEVEINGVKTKVFTSAGAAYQEAYDLYQKALEEAYTNADGTADVVSYLTQMAQEYKDGIAAQQAIIDQYQPDVDTYNALNKQRDARQALEDLDKAFEEAGFADLTEEQIYDMSKELYKVKGIDKDDVREYLKNHSEVIPAGKDVDDVLDKYTEILSTNKDDLKLVHNYDGEGELLSKTTEELKTEIEGFQDTYDEATEQIKNANNNIAAIKKADVAGLAALEDDALTAEIAEMAAKAANAVEVFNNAQPTESGAIKITGSDAKIVLNGAEFTSSSNSFNVNGLTIEALAVTTEEISITTAVDTQGIYDKIKDFLTEYNSVINEITKLYNADSAKDYEPLTDEEKDSMSETQIEKWEDKIKDALLRRDSSLGAIMNAMTNAMSQSIEIDGQKLSLGNFGISTLGFLNAPKNEQYAYHIDGDEDDSKTAGNEDKLMKAIQENPDQILQFMKKLTSNLYTAIDSKMKSTELSSAYKVYNDKEMDKELNSIEELIKKWEDKVAAEEEYYYNKFSDMEVALSKLQSQTNSIAGLLGQ